MVFAPIDVKQLQSLNTGAHIQNICGGVLFDLGPTFMFVSDKCTDVYLPSFFQVPKPTQLKIQM